MTRIFLVLLGSLVLAAALGIGLGHVLTDQDVTIAACIVFALLSLVVAAELGAFRATLRVRPDGMEYRWLLGLVRRAIARPPVLECGSWMTRVTSTLVRDDEVNASEDVKTGSYVSVGALHVGGRHLDSSFSRWSPEGLRRGRRRRRVDVAPDRQGLLAFEWALAAEGWLTPARTTTARDP